MRRAIAAAVMGGLVLGGALVAPAFAATGSVERSGAGNATKTVVYDGYEFQVPANWPVYRLDEYPQTCVRYDIHAVYLGKPGPNMRCPAGLVGHTETLSITPGVAATPASAAKGSGQPAQTGGADVARLPAVHGTIAQNTVKHELSVTLGTAASGVTILGTYGTHPAVIEQVLKTLQAAPAKAAKAAQTKSEPVGSVATHAATSARAKSSPTKAAQNAPARKPLTKAPEPFHPVGGFDTCTAPSLTTMHVWRNDYAAVGVYIGGANYACAYGNLSASWVRTVIGSGWGVLPTYAGPQAPCWSGTGVTIDASKAAAEGTAAGTDAVNQARSFDIAPGSPIYYDMEAYNGTSSCRTAVLQFLGAWDRQVTAAGYVTGVYSSQDSGITDMQAAVAAASAGFTPPDTIWIALWDNNPVLSDTSLAWSPSQQDKQYSGNVTETFGGITLNVDKDVVGGPVASLTAAAALPEQRRETSSREPP